jgi:protein-ribulosamine 3-kinase
MNLREIEFIVNESVVRTEPLSGGCIANTRKLFSESGQVFVLKDGIDGDMFLKEANGLCELRKSDSIRVPEVIQVTREFLLMEYIQEGRASNEFFFEFGHQLAIMHKTTNQKFGFYEDNFIGTTPQINIAKGREATNWIDFYFSKRLLYQFHLAEANGYVDEKFRRLFMNLEKCLYAILSGSEEPPSLIHGDLWSGNYLIDNSGNPVLIDPAVYYGHREAELAMTRLFGGFGANFYAGYAETSPLKPGYEYREGVYTLYHVLNHLNLFGRSYRSQAIALMECYF